jgi:hypothetical protein
VQQLLQDPDLRHDDICRAVDLKIVIPAKAGIQRLYSIRLLPKSQTQANFP